MSQMVLTAARRRQPPSVRCEQWERFGCPGGAAGDEFAPPVDVRCTSPATHVLKERDPFPVPGAPAVARLKVCGFHGEVARRHGERVYRFRTVR